MTMKAGTAQINITPEAGIDLCGYVARIQPSIGKHDDLFARILYLEHDGRKILWLHADLIGFDNDLATRIRQRAASSLALDANDVFLSATHTHAGPATVFLRHCGNIDANYVQLLTNAMADGAREAARNMEKVSLCLAETQLDGIARDRRPPSPHAHTDTTLPVVGFRRGDGSYKAVVANYAIHHVGFSSGNRLISADIAGFAACQAGASLAGSPLVMLTNGGCGNVNPVAITDDDAAIRKYGTHLAAGIIQALAQARPDADEELSVSSLTLTLPQEDISLEELDDILDRHREDFANSDKGYVPSRVFDAYSRWHAETREIIAKKREHTPAIARIHVLKIGSTLFAGINMEVFSAMAPQLRHASGRSRLYVVGYSNGCIGYLAPQSIYAEGGYEVDGAHKFYGHFQLSPGGFERVRDKTVEMVHQLCASPPRLAR